MFLSALSRSFSVAITLLIYQRSKWIDNSASLQQYTTLLFPVIYFAVRDMWMHTTNYEAYTKYYNLVQQHSGPVRNTAPLPSSTHEIGADSNSNDEEEEESSAAVL